MIFFIFRFDGFIHEELAAMGIIRVEVLHAFAAQDDTEDLETTDKFKLAVVQNKLLGPVVYR